MKYFFLVVLILLTSLVQAQTKKVLLEEFTGARCGNCPMGSYYIDSMLAKYPDLITVSLHGDRKSTRLNSSH